MFPSCKKQLYRRLLFGFFFGMILLSGWTLPNNEEDLKWIQRCLLTCFNVFSDTTLKKWDLTVTPSGFLRFKKVYEGGKQEYFSFNLKRFQDLEYNGSEKEGVLMLKTKSDDIIVQTYNDPKGNIDTMSTHLEINITHLDAQQLDSLKTKIRMLTL